MLASQYTYWMTHMVCQNMYYMHRSPDWLTLDPDCWLLNLTGYYLIKKPLKLFCSMSLWVIGSSALTGVSRLVGICQYLCVDETEQEYKPTNFREQEWDFEHRTTNFSSTFLVLTTLPYKNRFQQVALKYSASYLRATLQTGLLLYPLPTPALVWNTSEVH